MADNFYDRIKEQNAEAETTPTTVAQTTDQTTEQTTPPTETEKPKEETSFDVGGINEYFGTAFENADSLKSIFESQEKYKDYETQFEAKNKELSSAHEKYNTLLDAIDPEKVLPDKDTVALSQLVSKYPNADLSTLSFVRQHDIGTMDPLAALVMIDKLQVKSNVSDTVRQAEILESLGIKEEDMSELTDSDRYKIEREFTTKSNLLNEIKEFQPELTTFDFEGERTARQQQQEADTKSLNAHNEKALKIILDGYKETKSVYQENGKDRAYSFVVSDDFKQKNFNEILTTLSKTGYKITPENANEIATEIDNMYWIRNRHTIMHDAIKQALSKEKEQTHDENHTNSPTNKTESPQTQAKVPKTVMEQFRAGLKNR